MTIEFIHRIIAETTVQLRKGDVFEGTKELVDQASAGDKLTAGGMLHVFAMPHESTATGLDLVDVHFIKIGVDKEKAESRKDELISALDKANFVDRLRLGPSYIEVGVYLGDQGAALQLFGLGKVLGLWEIITPESIGMDGEDADKLAGFGMVLIDGYKGR